MGDLPGSMAVVKNDRNRLLNKRKTLVNCGIPVLRSLDCSLCKQRARSPTVESRNVYHLVKSLFVYLVGLWGHSSWW